MMTSIHLRKPPYPQYPNVPRGILHATKKKKTNHGRLTRWVPSRCRRPPHPGDGYVIPSGKLTFNHHLTIWIWVKMEDLGDHRC